MWLLPALSRISAFAMRTYYRFHVSGGPVPATGPLLLVANHPNSILDPGGVCAAAGRPVRFLAKAPLFSYPVAGSLFRAVGAIPVYRRVDNPAEVEKNEEMFRAVRGALAGGSAVGIFPEGITHNLPALGSLRTGAARIALGTARMLGQAFPVVPVGLFFHQKDTFRSRALAMVGQPIRWDDLSGRSDTDPDAVRELTRRIHEALHALTVNLERWEDAAAVEAAAAIYGAEFSTKRGPDIQLRRIQNMIGGLRELRQRNPERLEPLLRSVLHFRDVLSHLRLDPGDLSMTPQWAVAVRWVARRFVAFLLAAPVALVGRLLFYPPYAATRFVAARTKPSIEMKSTVKVLGGAAIYLLWIILLSIVAGLYVGGWAAAGVSIILPLLAILTMYCYEIIREDLGDARAFLLLRRRGTLRERLIARRRELAEELEQIRQELGIARADAEAS